MVMNNSGGLNPPPKPTTPSLAPWQDAADIKALLAQLVAANNAYNAAFMQFAQALSAGQNITVNVPSSTIVAPGGPSGAPMPPTAPVRINDIDFGFATGGAVNTLTDTTKSWQPGALQGAFIFITMGNQTYQSTVTANSNNQLTFTAIAVAVNAGAPYSIRQPAYGNKGSFVTGKFVISSTGVGYNLPNVPIPWGTGAFLMAHPNNGGLIYFANTQALVLASSPAATTGNMRFEYLNPGDSIPLHDGNLNEYWIDGNNATDAVVWKI